MNKHTRIHIRKRAPDRAYLCAISARARLRGRESAPATAYANAHSTCACIGLQRTRCAESITFRPHVHARALSYGAAACALKVGG